MNDLEDDMKRSSINLASAVLGVLLGLQAASAEEKVISLFNGKTLDGWTTVSGQPVTRGWIVEDGMIVRTAGGGPIYSADEYGDFEFNFEWRIATRGNSGVKYRVVHYDKGVFGRPGWLGCEYQIFDDAGRNAKGKGSAGALYALYAPNDKKQLKPIDEFNQSRIVVRGATIEHWLNGEKIVEAVVGSDDWNQRLKSSKFGRVEGSFPAPKGRIQLQDHGSKVWFRNLSLRVLSAE
jgi:hypothetical protein